MSTSEQLQDPSASVAGASHPPRARLKRGKRSIIWTNLARSKRNIALSSVGILVGVGALVFFIGLGEGIKRVVLGKIFLVDQVEVIPPKVSMGSQMLGALFGANPDTNALDDEITQSFNDIDGIEGAYPKMKFTFPAFGFGGRNILKREIRGEMIADGIDPQLVAGEIEPAARFTDREVQTSCEADSDCDVGMTCAGQVCAPMSCTPPPRKKRGSTPDSCPGESYCAADVKQCLRPIPVILNPQIFELYNGGLAIALKLPKISPSIVNRLTFNVVLNRSAIMGKRGKTKLRKFQIVGNSDKAINLGATLPIDYVKRFNRQFTSDEAASHYHSVILKVRDQRRFPEIVQAVKDRGLTLAEQTENAVKAAQVILSIEAVFTLISLVIVAIASLNISQLFFMLITQRRREIGLLRALGASPMDVRLITFGEATVIGLIGGALGVLAGWLASLGVDMLVEQLPRFPYKPDSLFVFPWWTPLVGLGVAVTFCILGAFFPGREAARQEPAEALTQ